MLYPEYRLNTVPAFGESFEMEPNKLDICSKATSEMDLLIGCRKYKCDTIKILFHLTQRASINQINKFAVYTYLDHHSFLKIHFG